VKPHDADARSPADAPAASSSLSPGSVAADGMEPPTLAPEARYALIPDEDDGLAELTLERPTARLNASEGAGLDMTITARRAAPAPATPAPLALPTPWPASPPPASAAALVAAPSAAAPAFAAAPAAAGGGPTTGSTAGPPSSRVPSSLPFASLLPVPPASPAPSSSPATPPFAFPLNPPPAAAPADYDLGPPTPSTLVPWAGDEGDSADAAAVARIEQVEELEGDDAFENVKTTEVSTLRAEGRVGRTPSSPSSSPLGAPSFEASPGGVPGQTVSLDDDATRPVSSLYVASLSMAAVPPEPVAYDAEPFAGTVLDETTADLEIARPYVDPPFSSDDNSRLPTDEGATVEGAPVDEPRTDMGPVPPAAGATLVADDHTVVQLEDSLGEQGGMVFYRARLLREGADLGQPFTAVWAPQAPPEPLWSHLPDARVVRPRCRVTLERAAVRVFERPRGNTVVDYLADDDKLLGAMQVIELGLELAELLESMHGAGLYLYDLDPSQIVVERGGRVRLYAVGGVYSAGQLPRGPLGPFCAPEVRRRMSYCIGAAADVYAVALLLYALLAKRAPLEVDTDPALLVSPRVFRPECPLGIWPLLRICLDAHSLRRVGHARGLREVLQRIRARLLAELKASEDQTPVLLESWAELHTGITKARRGSNQQDRALAVTEATARTGLYVISDGVSRSRYGDGAFAAEQVETVALQRWTGLEKAGPQALALEHAQRADILKQIARSAGKKIATEINARYAPIPNEPNQVMSATLMAAFIVDGDATIGNLGDSRAYLVRDGVIEQISIDHDRITDALRLGLTFREATQVQMGTALTRVVGRVVVDNDGTCRADPFEPELFRLRLLPGDRLVLCSDGVADFVAGAGVAQAEQDDKIRQAVLEHEDPARAAFELVVLANRVGGYDNISCVVIAVHPA